MEAYEIENKRLEIIQDNHAESPRSWDNLGTMACIHRRYNLGDKHEMDAVELNSFVKKVKREGGIVLPLFLYDHSGITMKTTPFGDPWDSGQVGYIYITKEKIRSEYNIKRLSPKKRKQIISYLEGEVETYDQFLTGDVYGFKLYEKQEVTTTIKGIEGEEESIQWNETDSCWGFYGSDYKTNGMLDHIGKEWENATKASEMVEYA